MYLKIFLCYLRLNNLCVNNFEKLKKLFIERNISYLCCY